MALQKQHRYLSSAMRKMLSSKFWDWGMDTPMVRKKLRPKRSFNSALFLCSRLQKVYHLMGRASLCFWSTQDRNAPLRYPGSVLLNADMCNVEIHAVLPFPDPYASSSLTEAPRNILKCLTDHVSSAKLDSCHRQNQSYFKRTLETRWNLIFFKQLQQPCFPIVNHTTSFLSSISLHTQYNYGPHCKMQNYNIP